LAKYNNRYTGSLGDPRPSPNGHPVNDFMIINERVHRIHKVIVHRFRMGDVEDPDLYASQPLWEWQQSEMGKWIMERAVDTPEWHRQIEPMSYGYQYAVIAKIKDIDYTFWTLKWGNNIDRGTV